jgi:hypothetical protein
MNKLLYILVYLTKNYPHKTELSDARLTKMLYLADWLSANRRKKQISDIRWYYDNYGPYVKEIFNTVRNHNDIFSVDYTQNMFGGIKTIITLNNDKINVELLDEEKGILDHVIEKTKKLYWNDFIKLIYSTYPIVSSDRYTHLDLIQKAEEYQQV